MGGWAPWIEAHDVRRAHAEHAVPGSDSPYVDLDGAGGGSCRARGPRGAGHRRSIAFRPRAGRGGRTAPGWRRSRWRRCSRAGIAQEMHWLTAVTPIATGAFASTDATMRCAWCGVSGGEADAAGGDPPSSRSRGAKPAPQSDQARSRTISPSALVLRRRPTSRFPQHRSRWWRSMTREVISSPSGSTRLARLAQAPAFAEETTGAGAVAGGLAALAEALRKRISARHPAL